MKLDCKNEKGIVVLMVGETQNTFPYKNNKELFEIVEKMLKCNQKDIDIYDFDEKFIYSVFDENDLNNLKEELK